MSGAPVESRRHIWAPGAAIRDERLLRLAALDDTELVLVDSA